MSFPKNEVRKHLKDDFEVAVANAFNYGATLEEMYEAFEQTIRDLVKDIYGPIP